MYFSKEEIVQESKKIVKQRFIMAIFSTVFAYIWYVKGIMAGAAWLNVPLEFIYSRLDTEGGLSSPEVWISLAIGVLIYVGPGLVFIAAWKNVFSAKDKTYDEAMENLKDRQMDDYIRAEQEAQEEERKFHKYYNRDYEEWQRNGETGQRTNPFFGNNQGMSSSDPEVEKAKGMFFLGDRFTLSELKKARRDLVKRYSSDNTHNINDDEKMKAINAAYELLVPYAEKD